MPRLPFKYQILLGPMIIAITLVGLIWFTLTQFNQIQSQNENIRQWGMVTDRMHLAIVTGQRLINLATSLASSKEDQDELQFAYLEQSRIFSDNVLYPACFDRMSPAIRQLITQSEQKVRFDDNLNSQQVIDTLNKLIPRLEHQYNIWWAQKRVAYIDYYANVKIINQQLLNISLIVLITCLLLAGGATFWTLRNINSRLRKLAADAEAVCHGTLSEIPPPDKIIDEIDKVTECAARMTNRLVKVVAVEKILQGVEDERRRIAMDMHDQVLADLTAITRKLESCRQIPAAANETLQGEIKQLEAELLEAIQTTREVIDDLHPHSLEILGLNSAIETLCQRICKGNNCPQFYISIDPGIDKQLNKLQSITLYRICHELINNIIKHAKSSRYEVNIRMKDDELTLIVEDNGIGFDIKNVPSNGHGLGNIEERAKAINANFNWSASRFHTGSRFELNLLADQQDH